ncbi:SMP-30/gluconolactonase/LRE family protein [Viridibacterium curvum]|uniref:SMP-30/gluconolactonase/LRE family protein n=1 Tax=Viridibacterium curvum TaxID=1101404 RepID=A0ABP9QK01_9RHOO
MQPFSTLSIEKHTIISRDDTDTCGESPFWSQKDQAWYWSDIPAGRIQRWHPASGQFDRWQLPEQTGCVVQREDGRLLIACESGLFTLDTASGNFTRIADIAFPASGMRFNDGKCDRAGRLWVTSFMMASDKRPIGSLFCYSNGILREVIAGGFMTPNGMAFSPDNRTLYISDSHADVRKVWAIDYDIASGTLGERRLFVDMRDFAGRPDGATVDTEGGYWVAGMDAGCIYRFTPAGQLDRVVNLPVRHPTMPAFGGPAMDEVFVTSLKRGNIPVEQDPDAGKTLCFSIGNKGIAEVPYRG